MRSPGSLYAVSDVCVWDCILSTLAEPEASRAFSDWILSDRSSSSRGSKSRLRGLNHWLKTERVANYQIKLFLIPCHALLNGSHKISHGGHISFNIRLSQQYNGTDLLFLKQVWSSSKLKLVEQCFCWNSMGTLCHEYLTMDMNTEMRPAARHLLTVLMWKATKTTSKRTTKSFLFYYKTIFNLSWARWHVEYRICHWL